MQQTRVWSLATVHRFTTVRQDWSDLACTTAFKKIPEDGEGQGSLARCSPCGHKESDLVTEQQHNWSVPATAILKSQKYSSVDWYTPRVVNSRTIDIWTGWSFVEWGSCPVWPWEKRKSIICDNMCCGIQSCKTHPQGHSRQWSTVYYASRSKGNQFPTRTLMFLRGPVLYPPLRDWLHVSNLFVGYDWVLQQVGAAAAAAAKSLQSCPTLCDPIDGSPPGSPIPGILQARRLEWVAIYFSKVGAGRTNS